MKYAVIQVVNGSCSVVAEGFTDVNKARITYHNTCKNLYGDIANVKAMGVLIIDSIGNVIERELYAVDPNEVEEPVEE